jgi:hypothetical protein
MRRAGYLIVHTPFAKLYWDEAQLDKLRSGSERILRRRCADLLKRGRYYNSNLSRERANFSIQRLE